MRVQEISGKDVHNMKARSLIKRGPASSQQIQHLRGGTGVQGIQEKHGKTRKRQDEGGCRGGSGGSRGGPGAVWLGYYAATSRI